MPRIGSPIGTALPATIGPVAVAATVASEGPYMLCMRRPAVHAVTSSSGHASPPTMTASRSSRPSGGTVASAAGVMNAWVTRSARSSRDSSAPPYRPAGATTTVAPAAKPSSSSSTEASKDGDEKCSVRAESVTPNRCICSCARDASPACVTTTALGVPVEPEV